MPYSIDRYNGTTLTVVEDGTVDNTLDIKLIGKNYAGYGEVQNENFVHLLENFSGTAAPAKPLSGQLWFDYSAKKLKFFDDSKWRTTGGSEVSGTAPTGLTEGDFWWDSNNNQLYSWSLTGTPNNTPGFVLIGPQKAVGLGTTQMRSRSVKDTNGDSHAIMEAILDDEVIYIVSADEFTLNNSLNAIVGFSTIKQGITMVNTGSTGVTTSAHRYWGTASNALSLNGFTSDDFVLAGSASFTTSVDFSDLGFTVGDDNDLAILVESGTTPVIKNSVGNTIKFQTTSSGVKTPLTLVGNDILPGNSDASSNIGSNSARYGTIFGTTFDGTATRATSVMVSGVARTAATASTANTVVARDANEDIWANLFRGTATSAQYADLAEKYLADADYEVGTVVAVGGEKEVTASKIGDRALGVVSGKPAYMMNSELEGGTYIALKGRVPVKVIGTVKKGDRLAAHNDGCAIAVASNSTDVFAIALESSDVYGVKFVEAVVL